MLSLSPSVVSVTLASSALGSLIREVTGELRVIARDDRGDPLDPEVVDDGEGAIVVHVPRGPSGLDVALEGWPEDAPEPWTMVRLGVTHGILGAPEVGPTSTGTFVATAPFPFVRSTHISLLAYLKRHLRLDAAALRFASVASVLGVMVDPRTTTSIVVDTDVEQSLVVRASTRIEEFMVQSVFDEASANPVRDFEGQVVGNVSIPCAGDVPYPMLLTVLPNHIRGKWTYNKAKPWSYVTLRVHAIDERRGGLRTHLFSQTVCIGGAANARTSAKLADQFEDFKASLSEFCAHHFSRNPFGGMLAVPLPRRVPTKRPRQHSHLRLLEETLRLVLPHSDKVRALLGSLETEHWSSLRSELCRRVVETRSEIPSSLGGTRAEVGAAMLGMLEPEDAMAILLGIKGAAAPIEVAANDLSDAEKRALLTSLLS